MGLVFGFLATTFEYLSAISYMYEPVHHLVDGSDGPTARAGGDGREDHGALCKCVWGVGVG